jgi:hypothetical protein
VQPHLDAVEKPDPEECPNCGHPTKVRVAKTGWRKGKEFIGCTNFPACTWLRDVETEEQRSKWRGGKKPVKVELVDPATLPPVFKMADGTVFQALHARVTMADGTVLVDTYPKPPTFQEMVAKRKKHGW